MTHYRNLLLAIALLFAAPALAQTDATAARAAVEAAMVDSAAGWSAGDLDRFIAVYSDAAETSYVTSRGLVRGKAAIADSYRPRFGTGPRAAERGVLTFDLLDLRLLGDRHALLIARYHVKTADGKEATGPTSLVFVHEAGGWKIVADHSS
jgi:uncharacterized protein (TIGR02246 family)